jgi:hypothetical protein
MSDKKLPLIWLRVLATLTGLSLPTSALLLRSSLEGQLALATPEQLTTGLILLLLVLGIVLTLFILQRPSLKWDEPTGTWVSRFTAIRYCAKCKAANIVTPLKNEVTGWRCMHCQYFFHDPARKKEATPRDTGGM